jgi:hypothetical protein
VRHIPATVAIVVFLSVFASACNAYPSPHNLPIVQFIDFQITQWLEEQAMESGVELFPWGIYALNKDIVFLFGSLQVPARSIRSVLLRSNDEGKHWREVMQPETGSDVTELIFVEGGYGWALVLWTVEGAGPACLYHTTDHGASWQKLSDIPFFGGHSATFDMQFFDKQHGQVRVEILDGEAGCCLLDSTDGGLTWEETSGCQSADECDFGWRNHITVWAQDASQWQLKVQSFDVPRELRQIKISRRLPSEEMWALVSSIPVHFEYSNGQLVVP